MNDGQIRVGWIGTGVMGAAMCGHLLAAGHPVTVFNRTRERAEGLLEAGAVWALSPAEVAAASDVVFTIVGYPSDVRGVVLGEEGVLAGAPPGSVLVDMTTSEPTLARQISDDYQGKTLQALAVLENSFIFVADLVRAVEIPVVCTFVKPRYRSSSFRLLLSIL